ncbi:hypothetical protein ACJX0J_023990, partial [Zea mays]
MILLAYLYIKCQVLIEAVFLLNNYREFFLSHTQPYAGIMVGCLPHAVFAVLLYDFPLSSVNIFCFFIGLRDGLVYNGTSEADRAPIDIYVRKLSFFSTSIIKKMQSVIVLFTTEISTFVIFWHIWPNRYHWKRTSNNDPSVMPKKSGLEHKLSKILTAVRIWRNESCVKESEIPEPEGHVAAIDSF